MSQRVSFVIVPIALLILGGVGQVFFATQKQGKTAVTQTMKAHVFSLLPMWIAQAVLEMVQNMCAGLYVLSEQTSMKLTETATALHANQSELEGLSRCCSSVRNKFLFSV